MAENYKEFDKSQILPEIHIRRFSFRVRELILAGLAAVTLVACLILAIILGAQRGSVTYPPVVASPICNSPPCFRAAAYTIENLNISVDPCQNFHQYVCGNFPKNNPLNPEISQKTVFWNLYYDNEDKLRTLMESPPIRATVWSSEKKLKDLFNSCMDDYGKMSLGGKPFLDKVIAPIGGWNVLGNWNEASWNFQAALQKASVDFWTPCLFTFRVTTDYYSAQKRIIELDLSGMGMFYGYYIREINQKIQNDYKDFMRTVADLLIRDSGIKMNETMKNSSIEQFVLDAYNIEFQLANITTNTLPTEDPHHPDKKITIRDLTSQTGGMIDFTGLLKYMFKESGVTESTYVALKEDDWIRRMTAMVGSLPANEKNRILNNYIVWRLAKRYVQDLSWEYIHANRDFYVDMTGMAAFMGTWRYCFNYISQYFRDALGALYVRDHFADKNKEKVHEITNYIKEALIDSVLKGTIMDQDTKVSARAKLQRAVDKLGYPDFMMDDAQLDAIYASITVNRSDYFQNVLNINTFQQADLNRRLKQMDTKDDWLYRTYDTSMNFINSWNQLLVPAGLLQFPLYDYSLPHYSNFGCIGGLIGHYYIHSIDKWGSMYGPDGMYSNWWTNETKDNYDAAESCFSRAFDNKTMGPYKVPGNTRPISILVQGKRFAWEGMAETSGVRLAYKAYKNWENKNGNELSAPGMNKTNDQMFFISYAQTTCFSRTDELSYNYALGQRIPEDVRTNTVMSQLDEFVSAFNCPATSPMNAKEKCTLFS
ncbi:hypothetical protein CHS0354_005871 [Potamilus streckersoni]|uniref:Endothelin-converting enzyme 1 n=1 Tax=Potamilus streckersoni TaxID=2493646 RepID=A0AAE0W9N0_9BIVA|nr:hypothetical protein CHS0354_005871 [Potamilus streckersoni]